MDNSEARFYDLLASTRTALCLFLRDREVDEDVAEEVVQETHAKLVERAKAGAIGDMERLNFSYLCRVAINGFIDRYRRKRRQRNAQLADDYEPIDPATGPLGQLLSREIDEFHYRLLSECLQGLSELERSVVEQRIEGLRNPEIGLKVGRSVESVAQALFRAQNKLRTCVQLKLAKDAGPSGPGRPL